MREVEEDGDEGVVGLQGGLGDDEEDAEEEGVPDLSGVHVEVVDSTHEGTKWLIVNGVTSRKNGLERSSGDAQTGDGSSALLPSQLGRKTEKSRSLR